MKRRQVGQRQAVNLGMPDAADEVVMLQRVVGGESADESATGSAADEQIAASHRRLPTVDFDRQHDRRLTFATGKTRAADQVTLRTIADRDRVTLQCLSHR